MKNNHKSRLCGEGRYTRNSDTVRHSALSFDGPWLEGLVKRDASTYYNEFSWCALIGGMRETSYTDWRNASVFKSLTESPPHGARACATRVIFFPKNTTNLGYGDFNAGKFVPKAGNFHRVLEKSRRLSAITDSATGCFYDLHF